MQHETPFLNKNIQSIAHVPGTVIDRVGTLAGDPGVGEPALDRKELPRGPGLFQCWVMKGGQISEQAQEILYLEEQAVQ